MGNIATPALDLGQIPVLLGRTEQLVGVILPSEVDPPGLTKFLPLRVHITVPTFARSMKDPSITVRVLIDRFHRTSSGLRR